MAVEDDRSAEWDEEADTFVTGAGAVPQLVPDDEDDTTPRRTFCPRCGRPVKTGGDAARPTWLEMAQNAPDACWASMGCSWRWCSGRRPWQLVLVVESAEPLYPQETP